MTLVYCVMIFYCASKLILYCSGYSLFDPHSSMTKINYFDDSVRPLILFFSYSALVIFVLLMLSNWFDVLNYAPLWAFRFFSVVILSFLAGSLWGLAFVLMPQDQTFEFKRFGLIWGGLIVVLSGWGLLFVDAKVGVFITALIYLVLWQIELKTNLAKLYPEWYWVLRTKLTMGVAMCHILLWLTLS